MNRTHSQERPELVELGRSINPVTNTNYINIDIVEEEESEQGKYSYLQIEVYPSKMTYPGIVSAIIRAEYDADAMEAIINNYILSPEDEDARKAFDQMQAWRQYAKAIAREVLEAK